MKNMRITTKPVIDTEPMGFVVDDKNFDFTVRVLGAGKGKLKFFEESKTTTVGIRSLDGRAKEVRELFESVELTDEDFFFSVSVPYVDKYDLLNKVAEIYASK